MVAVFVKTNHIRKNYAIVFFILKQVTQIKKMKINKSLFIATLLVAVSSNAQIDKGNWMMGGGATFSSSKNKYDGITSKSTGFQIRPIIGYFIIDKLAVGTSGEFSFVGSSQNFNTYGIGPFVRYYFLEKEKTINIFSEVSYEFSSITQVHSKAENFKIKAGTVFFLNSSVGLEVALNYLNQKVNDGTQNNNVFLGVGFQIHLEKE